MTNPITKYVNIMKTMIWMMVFFAFPMVVLGAWQEPTQPAPNGNISGPVLLDPAQAQTGSINIISNSPIGLRIDSVGQTGIQGVGAKIGVSGISGSQAGAVGVLGTTEAESGYGIYAQADTGYALGIEGRGLLLPTSTNLKGDQGSFYFEKDTNRAKICLVENSKGGCSLESDWDDLVFGAWDKQENNLVLDDGLAVNGPDEGHFYMNSSRDLQLRLDSDNNDDSKFVINNGENQTILQVTEDGNVEISGDLIIASGHGVRLDGVLRTAWGANTSTADGSSSSSEESTDDSSNESSNTNNTGHGIVVTLEDAYKKGNKITLENKAIELVGAGLQRALDIEVTGSSATGLQVQTDGSSGYAIQAFNTASSGNAYGIYAETGSPDGRALYGLASSGAGLSTGVYGLAISSTGRGVYGESSGASGIGIYAKASGSNGTGLYAFASNGLSAQFAGQEVVIGDDESAKSSEISEDGDLYIEKDLEVDGKICLGDECRSTWSTAGDMCNGPQFSGFSSGISNGRAGGYKSADNKCPQGQYICTPDDMIRSIRCAEPSAPIFSESGSGWINGGPSGSSSGANDCNGWTSRDSTSFGSFWNFKSGGDTQGGGGYTARCNVAKNFACCQ
jgi:hypothetical protein